MGRFVVLLDVFLCALDFWRMRASCLVRTKNVYRTFVNISFTKAACSRICCNKYCERFSRVVGAKKISRVARDYGWLRVIAWICVRGRGWRGWCGIV